MLVLVIVISAIILGGYTFIVYHDITSRARRSIEEYLKDPNYYMNDRSDSFLFVYELYVSPDPQDYIYYIEEENETYSYEYEPDTLEYIEEEKETYSYSYELDTLEQKLADYYYSNKTSFSYDNIYKYFQFGTSIIFMPMDKEQWRDEYEWRFFNEETMDSLLYCDITYLLSILFNNVLLVSVIIAAMVLLMFFVSRYTVKMLDEKDTGMKNFFANASHELKTPLMSIRGNVDGIRDGYVEVSEGCEVIERQVDRMSELIGAILDISRLDSKAVEPCMLDCDVREIIYDAASAVMQEAQRRGISLDIDIPDPIFRKCDEAMLYSAFSNILTNDVRYADSLIFIHTEVLKPDEVNIIFENDGEPVSESDMEHIFDRFYKGEKGQSG